MHHIDPFSIALWDVQFHANTERFQGLVPLWSHLCPLSVQLGGGGGGYVGHIRKALEKGFSEHPRFACCTNNMFEIFLRFGRCLCCLLRIFVNR